MGGGARRVSHLWVLPRSCSFASFRSVMTERGRVTYTYTASEPSLWELRSPLFTSAWSVWDAYHNAIEEYHDIAERNEGAYLGEFYNIDWDTVQSEGDAPWDGRLKSSYIWTPYDDDVVPEGNKPIVTWWTWLDTGDVQVNVSPPPPPLDAPLVASPKMNYAAQHRVEVLPSPTQQEWQAALQLVRQQHDPNPSLSPGEYILSELDNPDTPVDHIERLCKLVKDFVGFNEPLFQ